MVWLETISTLAFFAVVGVLLVIDRKNIEFNHGLVLRRWKGGIERIDKLVARRGRLFHYLGLFSIVIGILGSAVGIGYMVYSAITLTPSFGLVLPSVGGVEYPGPVIGIPFWYWIIAIFVIVTTHESMHAVFARLANVPIKSYGIILLLTLPMGAFVDPDEKKIRSLKTISKMKIFSAGSFANFATALVAVLLVVSTGLATNALVESAGVKFESTAEGSPASAVGLSGIIYRINADDVKNVYDVSAHLSKLRPYENVTVATTAGTFQLTTAQNPGNESLAYLGISNAMNAYEYKLFPGYVPNFIIDSLVTWNRLLLWVLLLSIGVGIVNMLPIMPLDGGRMFQEIFNKAFKTRAKVIGRVVSVVVLGLILFNLIGVWILRTLL
jgi:membrane-associated protease RseP (regulator of RpoE activity)